MIKSTIKGTKELKREIEKIANSLDAPMLSVGIHDDAADPPEGEINMATLGAVHEFGTDKIPARPWLLRGFNSGRKEYEEILEEGINDTVKKGIDIRKAFHKVGVVAVGKVQLFITKLKTPPNSEITIARKGSSNPLIDTGAMRGSVNYKLHKEKLEEGL